MSEQENDSTTESVEPKGVPQRRHAVLGRRRFLSGESLSKQPTPSPNYGWGWLPTCTTPTRPASGTRYYRETLTKFAEVAKRFDQEKPDLVVCLGDNIDSAASLDAEKGYLRRIAKEFSRTSRPTPLRPWQPLRRKPDEARVPGDRRAEVVLLFL